MRLLSALPSPPASSFLPLSPPSQVAHMQQEIAAIEAKDISQGGLTPGQTHQIDKNRQRMQQVNGWRGNEGGVGGR